MDSTIYDTFNESAVDQLERYMTTAGLPPKPTTLNATRRRTNMKHTSRMKQRNILNRSSALKSLESYMLSPAQSLPDLAAMSPEREEDALYNLQQQHRFMAHSPTIFKNGRPTVSPGNSNNNDDNSPYSSSMMMSSNASSTTTPGSASNRLYNHYYHSSSVGSSHYTSSPSDNEGNHNNRHKKRRDNHNNDNNYKKKRKGSIRKYKKGTALKKHSGDSSSSKKRSRRRRKRSDAGDRTHYSDPTTSSQSKKTHRKQRQYLKKSTRKKHHDEEIEYDSYISSSNNSTSNYKKQPKRRNRNSNDRKKRKKIQRSSPLSSMTSPSSNDDSNAYTPSPRSSPKPYPQQTRHNSNKYYNNDSSIDIFEEEEDYYYVSNNENNINNNNNKSNRKRDAHGSNITHLTSKHVTSAFDGLMEEFKQGMKLDGIRHTKAMKKPLTPIAQDLSNDSTSSIDSHFSTPSPAVNSKTKMIRTNVITIQEENDEEEEHNEEQQDNNINLKINNIPGSKQKTIPRGKPAEQFVSHAIKSIALTPINPSRATAKLPKTPLPVPQLQKQNRALVGFEREQSKIENKEELLLISDENNTNSEYNNKSPSSNDNILIMDLKPLLRSILERIYKSFSRKPGEYLPIRTVERNLFGSNTLIRRKYLTVWDDNGNARSFVSLLKEVFQRCQLNEISINDFINLLEGCMVDSTMDNTNNIDNNNDDDNNNKDDDSDKNNDNNDDISSITSSASNKNSSSEEQMEEVIDVNVNAIEVNQSSYIRGSSGGSEVVVTQIEIATIVNENNIVNAGSVGSTPTTTERRRIQPDPHVTASSGSSNNRNAINENEDNNVVMARAGSGGSGEMLLMPPISAGVNRPRTESGAGGGGGTLSTVSPPHEEEIINNIDDDDNNNDDEEKNGDDDSQQQPLEEERCNNNDVNDEINTDDDTNIVNENIKKDVKLTLNDAITHIRMQQPPSVEERVNDDDVNDEINTDYDNNIVNENIKKDVKLTLNDAITHIHMQQQPIVEERVNNNDVNDEINTDDDNNIVNENIKKDIKLTLNDAITHIHMQQQPIVEECVNDDDNDMNEINTIDNNVISDNIKKDRKLTLSHKGITSIAIPNTNNQTIFSSTNLTKLKKIFDSRQLNEDNAANLRGLLGSLFTNDEANELLDAHVIDSSTSETTVLASFEDLIKIGLKSITWEELLMHFSSDKKVRQRAFNFAKAVSGALESNVLISSANEKVTKVDKKTEPITTAPPLPMSPPSYFNDDVLTPAPVKSRMFNIVGETLDLNVKEEDEHVEVDDLTKLAASQPIMKRYNKYKDNTSNLYINAGKKEIKAKVAESTSSIFKHMREVLENRGSHKSSSSRSSSTQNMIRGITVDDLSSKADNNNISFKAKPLPRSKSPQLKEELPQNILNNNPQSLIREMTTLNVVSGRKISSVATATVIVPRGRRNQPRRPALSPTPNVARKLSNRPSPKGMDMSSMSKTDLLKQRVKNRSPFNFQSKLDIGLGLTSSPSTSNVLTSTSKLLASAKKISVKHKVDSNGRKSPHMQHRRGEHERRQPRALNITSDESADSLLLNLNAVKDGKDDNTIAAETNESSMAASKLLQTLQASLDRPVFSPVVQGKANATMKTPTGNNSSPVSPMRMKLDSVTRSAQDILMRVRGQRLSENAGFGSDSPSFSYLKPTNISGTASSVLNSSSLQDRAKELSQRIKAMRERK